MTLGALIDLGLDGRELREVLSLAAQTEVELKVYRVQKNHLTGVKVEFASDFPQPTRSYGEICALVAQAPVSEKARERSLSMFRMLGEVEARIHSQPLEQVHFHELGGLDTILDVVGAAWGVEKLGITRIFCSSLPMGWGMIPSAHGRLPNPAPATLELLKGLPLYGTDLPGELVTPTGAVILKGLEAQYEPCPAMRLSGVGYGAGSRDLPGHPNLLRIFLGQSLAVAPGLRETVLVLETHIDDMNPEFYEPLMEGLFAAGALDVALAPLQMKKNRPGVRLTVIAPPAARESLLERLFLDSTTLGVRVMEVDRVAARRWQETVDTPYGPLEVKVMEYGGKRRVMPEYEACRRLGREHGLSVPEVYRMVKGMET
jgi:hypothetical protein